jgi:hypothetical protein
MVGRAIADVVSAVGARRAMVVAGCTAVGLSACRSSTGPAVRFSMAGMWNRKCAGRVRQFHHAPDPDGYDGLRNVG